MNRYLIRLVLVQHLLNSNHSAFNYYDVPENADDTNQSNYNHSVELSAQNIDERWHKSLLNDLFLTF